MTETIAHDQMLTEIVESVVIEIRQPIVQLGPHLAGKYAVAQALGRSDIFVRES